MSENKPRYPRRAEPTRTNDILCWEQAAPDAPVYVRMRNGKAFLSVHKSFESMLAHEHAKEVFSHLPAEQIRYEAEEIDGRRGMIAESGGPNKDAAMASEEAYLISRGWDHVMTEEDGVDTWRLPFELRSEMPKFVSRTQHYWDRDEAVALQKQIDSVMANKTSAPQPAPQGEVKQMAGDEVATVGLSCGRYYLEIAGIAVAVEGDACRHMLPEEAAEEISQDELDRASIGDKKASELPLDVVRFFRGQAWDGKSLRWAAKKINADHERTVAELRAEVERLKSQSVEPNQE